MKNPHGFPNPIIDRVRGLELFIDYDEGSFWRLLADDGFFDFPRQREVVVAALMARGSLHSCGVCGELSLHPVTDTLCHEDFCTPCGNLQSDCKCSVEEDVATWLARVTSHSSESVAQTATPTPVFDVV